jgi:hypothetical protein
LDRCSLNRLRSNEGEHCIDANRVFPGGGDEALRAPVVPFKNDSRRHTGKEMLL